MLFPLSKDFSSSGIFQKGGEHNQRPIKRVWTIDHTGSKDRTKELHLLLTDQKPYKHHERLAARRAQEGKKQDDDTLNAWKDHLRDMYQRIDGEAEGRRQEMYSQMRAYKRRNAASDSNLKQMLRDQAKDHLDFLKDMGGRVNSMPPMWGGEPLRETRERTQARKDAHKGVIEQTKDYKQAIKSLNSELDKRGPQEWTAVPRPSNETIQSRRKAKGLAELTQKKEDYESTLEAMMDREHQRVTSERREMRRQCREADLRLSQEKGDLLKSLNDTQAMKKAELDGIQARVNGRGNGRPDHPEFTGYATAGYTPVEKGAKRLRDHAAERADKDANHAESAAKLLTLSVPLSMRNRIVAAKPPKHMASLSGTGIDSPMEWTEMNWTQRWALISRHAPQNTIQKAHEKAGVDAQGKELTMSPTANQQTLSPRTLGMAQTS